jgi:uncharacterized protein YndB with AHSA1/START domain
MTTKTPRKHHGRLIDTSIRIETTPDRAWSAWTDPQAIANWFVDRAEGTAAPGEVMTWFFDTFHYRQRSSHRGAARPHVRHRQRRRPGTAGTPLSARDPHRA